jgi:hypothetical protein
MQTENLRVILSARTLILGRLKNDAPIDLFDDTSRVLLPCKKMHIAGVFVSHAT